MFRSFLYSVTICVGSIAFVASAEEQSSVKLTKLTDQVYLITGKGGNLGVSIGEDGTFLIDDKYAPMSNDIEKAIKSVGGSTPTFVLNTHWHGDHTGGNEHFGEQGSTIVAHENVRKRLSVDNYIKAFMSPQPAKPKVALPVITFSEEVQFHVNADTLEVTHIANAHTDGDSVVFFKEDNILHTGDLFFNGFYPFIDIDHGGSLKGMVRAANQLLSMIDDDSQIIPGHGPMATKADLIAYRDMLSTAYDKLSQLKQQGKSVDEVIAAKPLAAYEDKWASGLFSTDRWINIIYDGLE